MTSDKEALYWQTNKEWYRINEKGEFELTDKAPERARESFALFNTPRKDKKNPYD